MSPHVDINAGHLLLVSLVAHNIHISFIFLVPVCVLAVSGFNPLYWLFGRRSKYLNVKPLGAPICSIYTVGREILDSLIFRILNLRLNLIFI